MKGCLTTLDALFSDERVTVDTAILTRPASGNSTARSRGRVTARRAPAPAEPHPLGPGLAERRDPESAQGPRGEAADRAARPAQPAMVKGKASTCASGSRITASECDPRNRTVAERSSSSTNARSHRPTRTGPLRSSSATARSLPAASTLPAAGVLGAGRNSASGTNRTGGEAEGLGAETKNLAEGPGQGKGRE